MNALQIILLVLTDLISIYASLYIAFLMRKYLVIHIIEKLPSFDHQIQYYIVSLFWMPLVYIFFHFYHRLYTKKETFWEDAREYVKSYVISFILILTIITLSKESDEVSRIVMILFFVGNVCSNLILRYFIKKALYSVNIFKEDVLIIGAGKTGRALLRAIKRETYLGYKAVGFLDDDAKKHGKSIEGVEVIGSVDTIVTERSGDGIHKVFIALPSLDSEQMMELYIKLHRCFKEVVIIPQIKVMALMNSEVHHLFNDDLLLLNVKNNLNYKSNIFFKNMLDYLIAFLLFPFFLAVMAIIAFLIKIESKGPVFFKHRRYALNGKEVFVYKFRSMYHDAEERLEKLLKSNRELRREWGKSFKIKDDPRITKVGGVLRKTSLDELPQIVNVLKGEMSFIGPRPVVMDELKKYYDKFKEYFVNVKPGITGLWQVSGRNDTEYDYRVRTDIWYVLNWSIWLDIVVLFKTFKAVFQGRGAY